MLVLVIEIVKGSRQNECLANFAQRDRFRRIAERGLKAFDGFSQWFERIRSNRYYASTF